MIRLLDEAVSRAYRYRIYLHLDIGGRLNARGAIPRHPADRYACISAHAVSSSRTRRQTRQRRTHQRGIPARTRRLVEDRDRGRAYPGCPATRFVEIHHLHHWEDGGGTDYDNLICLTPHHPPGHRQGAFTITPAKPTLARARSPPTTGITAAARHATVCCAPSFPRRSGGRPIQVQPHHLVPTQLPTRRLAALRTSSRPRLQATGQSRTAGASYRGISANTST